MSASPEPRQSGDLFGDRGASFSDCGRYRYRLWRRWADGPEVLFVMLNPSTADAALDDPTIRRCRGFAARWGAGSLTVVNLYAWRATNPRDLLLPDGPVGEFPWQPHARHAINRNDVEIEEAAAKADRIVAAWGAWPGPIEWRPARVLEDLLLPHGNVEAVGLTKHGQPRHPLYMRGDARPVPYEQVVRRAA
jgi:hypothetical protein